MFKKNTAVTGFQIGHFVNATTGAAVTTGTPTCKRTIDGTGGACANAAAYNTNGAAWGIDLAAGDMNGDVIGLSFTLTDCLPISYTIRTGTKLVSELQDPTVASIQSGLATPTNITAGTITTVTNLTNAPTNGDLTTTMKTSAQTAANAALVANNLDHLMKTAVSDITKLGDGGGNEVPDSTVLSLMLCKGTDTDTYNHTTDSQEAIRDKLPTNLEDLSITDTTGIAKSDLVTVNGAAQTATLDTLKQDTEAVKLVTDKVDTLIETI